MPYILRVKGVSLGLIYGFEGVMVICNRTFFALKKGDDIYMMCYVILTLEKEKKDAVFSCGCRHAIEPRKILLSSCVIA